MRTRIWSGTCVAVAFAFTAGLLAQQPPPTQPPAQSMSAKSITVSGCLQRAEQAPTGTSGAAASGAAGATRSASETKFVLTNAAMSKSGTTGTAGTTPPSTAAVASEYRLDADDAKVTPHVGHKVEITGTVDAAPSTTQPPAAPAASAANAPKLKVDSVKMVAATCP